MDHTILLIGGAPTTGKSYTAQKIAKYLRLPWISTDSIREQMRKIVRPKDYPALFEHADATAAIAVEYLSKNSAEHIVQQQNKESTDVWEGVKALIDSDPWESFIIEGVAILPHLVSQLQASNKKIKVVFLIDENIERIRKTIFTRGLWDVADKYPDSVKEREVEWVLAFNDYIIREAKKYGYKIVRIGDRKKYLQRIKHFIA